MSAALIQHGKRTKFSGIRRAAAALGARLQRDTRGNILTIFAIALPLMIGGLGLGVEGANWYQMKRALQNAADRPSSPRQRTTLDLLERSPGGDRPIWLHQRHRQRDRYGEQCSDLSGRRQHLLQRDDHQEASADFFAGLRVCGNTTIGGANAELISATAIASYQTSPRNYCILALANSVQRSALLRSRRTARPRPI